MDYKKIAEAVRLCGTTPKVNQCQEKCPYYRGPDMYKCIPVMTKDAAEAIEHLLEEREKAIEIMRDAFGRCDRCKHFIGQPYGCNLPKGSVCNDKNDLYEWEGF